MKKINLLAVALAAFTMFSCSNEEIVDLGSNAPGERLLSPLRWKEKVIM